MHINAADWLYPFSMGMGFSTALQHLTGAYQENPSARECSVPLDQPRSSRADFSGMNKAVSKGGRERGFGSPYYANPWVAITRKIPFRLSAPQKRRQRKRLRSVDNVVATVDRTLKKHDMNSAMSIERWKEEMPTEAEMRARDKYTMFDRKERKYRKGIHSGFDRFPLVLDWSLRLGLMTGEIELPKWTRVSQRLNPPGF